MPFKKVGPDHYVSPSGHKFNAAQVKLYYANGGKFPGEKASVEDPAENVAQRAESGGKAKLRGFHTRTV